MMFQRKVNASTMIESLVALVVVSLVASFSILVFWNIQNGSGLLVAKVKAEMESLQLMDEYEDMLSKNPGMQPKSLNITTHEIELTTYGQNLYKLEVKMKSPNENIIYIRKRLVYGYEN